MQWQRKIDRRRERGFSGRRRGGNREVAERSTRRSSHKWIGGNGSKVHLPRNGGQRITRDWRTGWEGKEKKVPFAGVRQMMRFSWFIDQQWKSPSPVWPVQLSRIWSTAEKNLNAKTLNSICFFGALILLFSLFSLPPLSWHLQGDFHLRQERTRECPPLLLRLCLSLALHFTFHLCKCLTLDTLVILIEKSLHE